MKVIKGHKKLCIALVVAFLLFGWRAYSSHFTPQGWTDADPYSQRGYLVKSLLEQYDNLFGMTLDEVEALLGNEYNAGSKVDNELCFGRIYYPAGRKRAIFPEYLVIQFEYGHVVEAKVIAD